LQDKISKTTAHPSQATLPVQGIVSSCCIIVLPRGIWISNPHNYCIQCQQPSADRRFPSAGPLIVYSILSVQFHNALPIVQSDFYPCGRSLWRRPFIAPAKWVGIAETSPGANTHTSILRSSAIYQVLWKTS